jgi:hypothetical protein
MTQITGALVGIALVLSAVFVPMAFFGGSTGAIYRQFSLTIVSAMVLSVLVALILTPALCATLLKPMKHGEFGAQRGFFGWFNRFFDTNANRYQNGVRKVIKQGTRYGIIYLAMLAVLAVLFMRMPTSFLPEEDQGVMSMVQLPVGATKERTEVVLGEMRDYFLENEKENVDSVLTVAGFSFAGSGQNSGMAFIKLKDWSERKEKSAAPMPSSAAPWGSCSASRKPRSSPSTCPHSGTRHGHRLRLLPAGPRRSGSREADAGAQPVARHGGAGSQPGAGTPERDGRHAPARHQDRLREGAGPGALHHRHQQHPVGGLGLLLCERLRRQRPGQEGLSAGGCPFPDEPGRSEAVVRAQQRGPDGALLRLCQHGVELRLAPS